MIPLFIEIFFGTLYRVRIALGLRFVGQKGMGKGWGSRIRFCEQDVRDPIITSPLIINSLLEEYMVEKSKVRYVMKCCCIEYRSGTL